LPRFSGTAPEQEKQIISDDAPIVELRDLSCRFGQQHVLRDINISVHRGETLVIIGESGCGKSVTLKAMMSLLPPTSGCVLWNGHDVRDLATQQFNRMRLRFGFLFQGSALFDSMDVYDNVAFGLIHNTDMRGEAIQPIVHQGLRDVGLPIDVCGKKPAELSGGMKKRVALARALVMTPEVMFYDEPTTGLDPIMSDVINELVLQTREQRQVTSVVVTHDMRTVTKIADRILMLYPVSQKKPDESQVVFEGTPEQAFASDDPRVSQFVRGEARDRIRELSCA